MTIFFWFVCLSIEEMRTTSKTLHNMKALVFVFCMYWLERIASYSIFVNTISRRNIIGSTASSTLGFLAKQSFRSSKNGPLFIVPNTRVLIIGCQNAGFSILEELKKQDSSIHVTIATTKPRRVKWLKQLADDAVLIPQLATPTDEELARAILKSSAVVVADSVKMFSVHSFVRTASRIRAIVDKYAWDGVLGLLSSENAYGSVLGGQELREDCGIFPNLKHVPAPNLNRDNVFSWHVNPYAIALALRQAEDAIVGGPQSGFVLRTAGIWDDSVFRDAAMYTDGKHFPACVADSYISFCTSKRIAQAVYWALNRKVSGIFNLREKNMKGLTRGAFYEKVQEKYNSNSDGKVIWDPTMAFDEDKLFCVESRPFLPTSQRSNSQMICSKILEQGFFK